ncbi:MAG: M15 family metallopeptidase [Chloroflexota bacterium]
MPITSRPLASIVGTAALATAVLFGSLATSPPWTAAAGATLPACAYKDVLTPLRSYTVWRTTLLDTTYMLPSTYYPGDLVSTSGAGLNSGYGVRSLVITDLKAMATAAKGAGAPLAVQSAFRSYATQASTFSYWVSVAGYSQALLTSARAGHSEHQLGTSIDFRSSGGSAPWNYTDWATTATGKWLAANGWRYGFVMSYPKGKQALSCYAYEPWHYRYVGRVQAKQIHDSGLTSREWLWRSGTAAALVVTNTYSPAHKVLFAAGTYTGVKFDGLGAVVASQKVALATGSSAYASKRVTVYGTPYLFMSTGAWAGYYIRQSTGVTLT